MGRRRRGVDRPRRTDLPESGGVGFGCESDRDRALDLPAMVDVFPLPPLEILRKYSLTTLIPLIPCISRGKVHDEMLEPREVKINMKK